MKIDSKQLHFEVIKESFGEKVNILTRYQFTDETTAMHFYAKLHSKYEKQPEEEQLHWCCRFELHSPKMYATIISCFGYGVLTWRANPDSIFEEMYQRYTEGKK